MFDRLFSLDWAGLFVPTMSPLESVLRISVVYLVLFAVLRFVMKREAGALGITDLLVIVLIADATQNAMAGDYQSITDGLILAGTLVFWNWFLDYAAMRWSSARKIIRPAPLVLVQDGVTIDHNLRKELMTKDELLSALRLQGVERFEDVKLALMETDGRISVIPKEGNQHPPPEKKAAA